LVGKFVDKPPSFQQMKTGHFSKILVFKLCHFAIYRCTSSILASDKQFEVNLRCRRILAETTKAWNEDKMDEFFPIPQNQVALHILDGLGGHSKSLEMRLKLKKNALDRSEEIEERSLKEDQCSRKDSTDVADERLKEELQH
jgi:hypothetical protein